MIFLNNFHVETFWKKNTSFRSLKSVRAEHEKCELEKLGKELSLIIVLTDLSKIEVLKYITNSRPNYLALGISYFMHMFLTGVIMVIFSG